MATKTQVHPQGYHRYGFGHFVPCASFKARQFAPTGKKTDRDTTHYGHTGLSLPQITVRKLYNPNIHRRRKKKVSKSLNSHLLYSNSGHSQMPHLSDEAASHRGDQTDISTNDRVIKNGTPWWKWTQRDYHIKPTSYKNKISHFDQSNAHYDHSSIRSRHHLPSISSKGIKASKKKTKNHRHQVFSVTNRPLYTYGKYHPAYYETLHPSYFNHGRGMYFYNNGSLTTQYSSNSGHPYGNSLSTLYDKALKMRYYYSRSRSGIRPVLPSSRHMHKQSSIYLVDFNSSDPISSSYPRQISRRILPWMTAAVPSNSRTDFEYQRDSNVHQTEAKTSNKEGKMLLPKYTIDSSVFGDQNVQTFHQSRKLLESQMKVRNLQIELLDEMIALLEKTNYNASGTSTSSLASYLDSREGTPTLSTGGLRFTVTNLMDFFEMPESELKKYDNHLRSKMIEKSHKMHGLGVTGKGSEESSSNAEGNFAQQQLLFAINSLSTALPGEEMSGLPRNGAFGGALNLAHLRELSKHLKNEDLKTVIKSFGLPESLAANVLALLRNSKKHRKASNSDSERERLPNPYPDMVINGKTFKSLQEMLLLREMMARKRADAENARNTDTEQWRATFHSYEADGSDQLHQDHLSTHTLDEEYAHDSSDMYTNSDRSDDTHVSDHHGDEDETSFDEAEHSEHGKDGIDDIYQAVHNQPEWNVVDPVYFDKIVNTDLNDKLQMYKLEQETVILQSVKEDLQYLKDTLNGKLPPKRDVSLEESLHEADQDEENSVGSKNSDGEEDGVIGRDSNETEESLEQTSALECSKSESMDGVDHASCNDSHTNTASGGDCQSASVIEITSDSDNEHADHLSDVQEEDEATDVFVDANTTNSNMAALQVPSTISEEPNSLSCDNHKKTTSNSRRTKSFTSNRSGSKNALQKRRSSQQFQFGQTDSASLRRMSISFPKSDVGQHGGPSQWSQRNSGFSRQGMHSGQLRTPGTPEFKTEMMQDIGEISAVVNTIRDMVGPLQISSRPATVKSRESETRNSSSKGHRSGLSTQEASRQRQRAQKSEPSSPEISTKEIDHERRLRQKKQRQLEWELQQSFEVEKVEIMKRRKKIIEAKRQTEEHELEMQKVVNELEEQELLKLAQERERHMLQIERMKEEADMRQCLQLYEQTVLEEYDHTQAVLKDVDYTYITYYFGEGYSRRQREIERALELQARMEMERSFLEALNLKRAELLEKLKAAQEEFMKGLAVESDSVNHLLQISKAFVYSYFQAVPNQTYRVPEEAL